MAKKLYVGGLPYSSTEDGMRAAFEKFGEVTSSTIIMDKMTGRSRGFGFIEMADDAAADAAINGLNNADFEGRTLLVNEARPMTERPPRRDGNQGGGF